MAPTTTPSRTAAPRWLVVTTLAAKLALLALLAHALVQPDLPQYQGKGIGWRLLTYPICLAVVPLVTLGRRRRDRTAAHPWAIDLCVVLPFLIDTAGNTAGLYDSITWWDDLMHTVTWVPWVTAAGLALLAQRPARPRVDVAAMTLGFGAATHILWELAEFVTFVQGNPAESTTAYRDTMGDLALSLLGSALGAALVAARASRRRRASAGAVAT